MKSQVIKSIYVSLIWTRKEENLTSTHRHQEWKYFEQEKKYLTSIPNAQLILKGYLRKYLAT